MPRSGGIYFSSYPQQAAGLPVLVLLHGAGGGGDQWPYQLRRLPGWHVLAPDLPGHGGSQGAPENSIGPEKSVGAHANHMLTWLAGLQIQRAVLVGHSMGAAIAMEMAIVEPERISHLVLFGAAARFPINPQLAEKLSVPVRVQEGVNMIVKWSFAKGADEQLRRAYFKQLMSNDSGVLHNDFLACANFDLGARITELRQPTLLLAGQDDVMVPIRLSQNLAAGLPHASLRVIAAGGHMFMQEQAEEAVRAIEAFLQRHKAD